MHFAVQVWFSELKRGSSSPLHFYILSDKINIKFQENICRALFLTPDYEG